jgi:hypothetical protein
VHCRVGASPRQRDRSAQSCMLLALVVWFRVADVKEECAERMSSVSGVESQVKGAGFDA